MSLRQHSPSISAPLPDVRTERLDLRRFVESDLDELVGVCAQREVWQFPFGRGFTPEETEQFLHRQIRHWDELDFGCWVARLTPEGGGNGEIVGYVGLSVPMFLPEVLPAVEVGWRFVPAVWGRGLASEGARAALDHAFATLGLQWVCSIPQADNTASVRVAERVGLPRRRPVTIPANDQRGALAAMVFEIDATEWSAARRA